MPHEGEYHQFDLEYIKIEISLRYPDMERDGDMEEEVR